LAGCFKAHQLVPNDLGLLSARFSSLILLRLTVDDVRNQQVGSSPQGIGILIRIHFNLGLKILSHRKAAINVVKPFLRLLSG